MSPTGRHDAHVHVFDTSNPVGERRTRQVMWLTLAMMVVEIVAGTVLGSMALLADGWHMSSHAQALGVSAGAYYLARCHAHDPRFSFGTWKIEVLGGYTTAVFLVGVAAYMGIESVSRLLNPEAIRFNEAIAIAVLGRPSTCCRPGCCRRDTARVISITATIITHTATAATATPIITT